MESRANRRDVGRKVAPVTNRMSTRLSPRIALVLALSPLLPVAAQTRTARPIAVRFEFQTRGGTDGQAPHSRVFLNANGKRTLVFSTNEGFQTMSRDSFADQHVPREALAACSGWWAGAGDNLYVVRRGARLDVYRQELDEGIEKPMPYRVIKSIRLSSR